MVVSRSALLHVVLPLCTLGPRLGNTLPAFAYDIDTVLELTSLLQLQRAVADVDIALCSGLLSAAQGGGVPAANGQAARGMVRRLLKQQMRARNVGASAVAAALRTNSMTRQQAAEASGHAKEAEERLAAILEYSGGGQLTDALDRPFQFMRPEELTLYHRALATAQQELEAAFECFALDERQGAVSLLNRGEAPPASLLAAVLGQPGYAAREKSIAEAIAALPSPAGTALTRSSLQAQLDMDYRDEQLKLRAPLVETRADDGAPPRP
jgi:hypothetical protein